MRRLVRLAGAAALATVALGGCGPSDDRTYREGDTPMASNNARPTLDARPDSTTGVASPTGQPGTAGVKVGQTTNVPGARPKAP